MSKIEHAGGGASANLLEVKYRALCLVGTLLIGCSSPGGGAEGGAANAGSGGAGAAGQSGGGTASAVQGGASGASSGGASAPAVTGGVGVIGSAGSSGSAGNAGSAGSAGAGGGASGSCTPSSGTEALAGGMVLDRATCLMWEAEPGFVAGGNWEPSKTYCENLSLGGFDDWRMPTVVELGSTPIAFIGRLCTDPRYVPDGTSDLGDFHYCGVVHWDPNQPLGCGWVGPANMDGTICVRGESAVTLSAPPGCTCDGGLSGFMPYPD